MWSANLLLLVLLIFCLNEKTTAGVCDTKGTANGCSTPGNIPWPYKKKFKPACNKHDHCYNCGDKLEIKRSKCDKKFFYNMLKICWKGSFWSMSTCIGYAGTYYGAVVAAGSSYWMKPSKSYCKQRWVKKCLW